MKEVNIIKRVAELGQEFVAMLKKTHGKVLTPKQIVYYNKKSEKMEKELNKLTRALKLIEMKNN